MIDLFALVLTHGLMALAGWRLVQRPDLDRDPGGEDEAPVRRSARRERPAARD